MMPWLKYAAPTRGRRALALLLMWGGHAAFAAPQPPPEPEVITNLVSLRRCAEQAAGAAHAFRIVAKVYDADCAAGVLVLRDNTGVEFIRLNLQGRGIEPGATVCLEGKGCGVKTQTFGLAVVPGIAVDNDGTHAMELRSGTVFLREGMNPIRLEWFNGPGESGLALEYEGPGVPRQPVPGSALFRARVDPAGGIANYSAGLDFRCFEGTWRFLPDFAKYRVVKSGVVTNFDLGVRTRTESVGLEFSGFIKIPRDGPYTFHLTSDDGSRLWIGEAAVEARVLEQEQRAAESGQTMPAQGAGRRWLSLEGTVNFVSLRGPGGELQMRVGSDDIRVDVFEGGDSLPRIPLGAKIKVTGIYEDSILEDGSVAPGVLRVATWNAVRSASRPDTLFVGANRARRLAPPGEATTAASTPPPLVTVAEIKTLSPELARQQIPVSIRGVLTTVIPEIFGAVLQDSTRGIFVYLEDPSKTQLPLRRGELYQIDGVTGPGWFAPVIVPRKITHLGPGHWPQPLHATWAQLVNGSLDTQYVEIDGVVTAVHDQALSLFTEGGPITLDLNGFAWGALAQYVNAVVRIRGCVFAPFDQSTHELKTGALLVGDAAVSVLQPAPHDLFDAPQKSISDLLLYDPEAAPFRRLKVSGQVIHGRSGEYFLSAGTNGLRVTTRNREAFAVGDVVEAVGFLGLGGPAAELREAVMRKTGHAPLPVPTKLTPDQLLLARYADTLVQVDATLMNQWSEGSEKVLELQSRFLAFRARVDSSGFSRLPPSGSRLELTGVHLPLGNLAGDGTVNGFQLLLPSAAAIRVLATPPWWTLERVLILAGALAALLCAALVWNKALQQQVQERGHQLETEIRHREQAEQQRAAEADRARIARDLHDDLGTGLTEVSLLASAGLGQTPSSEKGQDRFRAIADKARDLVSALDVIVWAIDPKRNSLQSFADYLGSYAEELLAASRIVCRLRIPIECEAVALPGTARHSLFLAIKEALNNVIRHAAATEVELKLTQLDHRLEIVIADNGRGFEWESLRRRNGLLNLQERLAALNGQCHIESEGGRGTTVTLSVPLDAQPA